MSPTEVEAKLVAPAPQAKLVIESLTTATTISGMAASPPQTHQLRDVYLDTPQRALAQWHGAMRIRSKDNDTLLTVKGPSDDRTGPAVSRLEMESPFTEANVHRTLAWLRDQIDDVRDLPEHPRVNPSPPSIEGLSPIHDRSTRRTTRVLTTPHGPVELAIDQAIFSTSAAEVTLVEFEVEAMAPTPIEGVVEGARAVQAHGAPIVALRPWRHSKLSVGLALERIDDFDGLLDAGVLNGSGLDRVHAELT